MDQEAEHMEGEIEQDTDVLETIPLVVVTPSDKKITITVALTDTVQDLRQYLMEGNETSFLTSYHFELNGHALSDYLEISETVPLGLQEGSLLYVIEDPYDERTARFHLRRFRDILYFEPSYRRTESPSVFSSITDGILVPNGGVPNETGSEPAKLQSFLPPNNKFPKAIKKLSYSGWNPPRGNRKLQGDLFYLDVETLEGTKSVITAWVNGFFVNASSATSFDPRPSSANCQAHSLVNLLRQLSPKFQDVFVTILTRHLASHPYELLPVSFPVTTWLRRAEEDFDYDSGRAEEALLSSSEVDFFVQGQERDWNEDLQLCRELPKSTPLERRTRDRSIYRVHHEFVDAAVKGAKTIIDGCVPSINAADDKKAHMYIYNNIFYSYSVDSRDIFKNHGGDAAAYKSASNDLIGLKLLNKIDTDGLYTLATAVINYRGYRIIAQSIIAGLFSSLMQEDPSSSPSIQIVYGSLEGEEVNADPHFHELVLKAAKALYLKPHALVDKKSGETVTIASHADIKGIRGTDGRKYILDLVRVTPRDYNYREDTDLTAILRPELVDLYIKDERDRCFMKHWDEQKKHLEELKAAGKPATLDDKAREELAAILENIRIDANPDVLTPFVLGGTDEEKEKDLELVKKLAAFLKDTIIPAFVDDFSCLRLRVVDGPTLTKLLHATGINLRYLGLITELLIEKKASAFIVHALQREMVVRVTRHIFNDYLKSVKDYALATSLSKLFNAFFGRLTKGNKGFQSGFPPATAPAKATAAEAEKGDVIPQQSLAQSVNADPLVVTHHTLWKQIRDKVKQKYSYSLPQVIPGEIFSIPTLRGICQKVGIQLVARKYTLEENAFLPSDIIGLFPIVKHSPPETKDGAQFFELGKSFMSEGRLDKAYEYLNAALEFFSHVYGPMHPDVGDCYANLAKVLSSAGDVQQALVYQQKATIMAERVQGLDHYDTANFYATLASLTQRVGRVDLAANYVKRALFLSRMASGAISTDEISFSTQLGTLLQEADKNEESLQYFKHALTLCETIYGNQSIQAASASHALATCLSCTGNAKDALPHETRNYQILKSVMGEQDLRTMQAKILMKQLTETAAVQSTKGAKERQDNRPVRTTLSQPIGIDAANLQQVQSALSDLSINEVMKWISDNSRGALDLQGVASPGAGLAGSKLRPNRAWGSAVSSSTATAVAASAKPTTTTHGKPAAQPAKQGGPAKQAPQTKPPAAVPAGQKETPKEVKATQTQTKRGRGGRRGRK